MSIKSLILPSFIRPVEKNIEEKPIAEKFGLFKTISSISRSIKDKIIQVNNNIRPSIKEIATEYIDPRLINKKSLAMATAVGVALSPETAVNMPQHQFNSNYSININEVNRPDTPFSKPINQIFPLEDKQEIATEKNDLLQFPAESFVSYQGEFYYVQESTKDQIILLNIKDAPGESQLFLSAIDNPIIKSAEAKDIIASLTTYIARYGMNAHDIALALGLKGWQANLIFIAQDILHSDKNIPANEPLYALPNAKIVQALFTQYQDYISQFKVGEAVICQPKQGEAKECKVLKVQDGQVNLITIHNNKPLKFSIGADQWDDYTVTKTNQVSAIKVNDKEETKKEIADKKLEADFKITTTKSKLINRNNVADNLDKLATDIKPQLEKDNTNEKINLATDLLADNHDLAKMLTVFFQGLNHHKLDNDDKAKIASGIMPMYERVESIVQNINIHPELEQRIKKLNNSLKPKQILAAILVGESSGQEILFPGDNGESWGKFQTQAGFAHNGLQKMSKMTNNYSLANVDLKFNELSQAYKEYNYQTRKIRANFNSKKIGIVEKNKQNAMVKRQFEKTVLALNSPVLSDPSLMGNIVLANYIDTMEKINQVGKNEKLATVNLSKEEKDFFDLMGYSYGENVLFDHKENGKIKSGIIKRYLYEKKNNPDLTPWQFLRQKGFKEDDINGVARKYVYAQFDQEFKQAEAKVQLEKYKAMYETAKTDIKAIKPVEDKHIKIPKTALSEAVISKNAQELQIIQSLLSTSDITATSKQNVLKAFILKLIINPKSNCEQVINDFIAEWEKENYLGDYNSLLNSLYKLKAKYQEKVQPVKTPTVAPEVKEIKGNIFNRISQGIKNKINGLVGYQPNWQEGYAV